MTHLKFTAPPRDPAFAIPGHAVTRPDGVRQWLLDDGVVIEEDRDVGVYLIHDPTLIEPAVVHAAELRGTAASSHSLFAARLHQARVTQASACPWHPESPESADDDEGQRLASAVVDALVAAGLIVPLPPVEEGDAT